MNTSCPIPTPAQKQYADIQDRAERAMMATIEEALRNARNHVAEELKTIEHEEEPPAHEYFVAVAHQKLFLMLCGADTETFEGGDPETADHIIRNVQNIRDHYWAEKA